MKIRECSEEPADDRSVDSDRLAEPSTPGRRQQNPRTIRSTDTPARDASQSAAMVAGSSSWFILATMRLGRPARWLSISRPMRSETLAHARRGDQDAIQRRHLRRPVRWWNRLTTSRGEHRIAREESDVGVEPRGPHVIVAGSDVCVTAQAGSLFPHDERDFRVVFRLTWPTVTCAPARSSSAAQCRFRSSSNRAFSSMTHATCLPASAALMSDRTNGVSSPTRTRSS